MAWGPAATWAAVLFLLGGITDPPSAPWLPHADKVGHVALYSVLGATLAWARLSSAPGSRVPHAVFVLAGVLYGVLDEWRQSSVPGRWATRGDVAADAVGVLLGYGGLRLLLTRREGPGRPPASGSSGT